MSEEKSNIILDAAMACFLRHGYQKTTLEDVANEAMISRSTIYVYFKNKEELFLSWIERTFKAVSQATKTIAKEDLPKDKKLYKLFTAWKLEPLKPIFASSFGKELFEEGHRLVGELKEKHQKEFAKILAPLVGGKEYAEIMLQATHGITCSAPSYASLEKSIHRLIEVFLGKHLKTT